MFKRFPILALLLVLIALPAHAAIPGPSDPIGTVATTAAANNLIPSVNPALLYGINVSTGAAIAFVMVFDATTIPADGAVTPKLCFGVPASLTTQLTFPHPVPLATGAAISISSTGCFTKTAVNANFISAQVR